MIFLDITILLQKGFKHEKTSNLKPLSTLIYTRLSAWRSRKFSIFFAVSDVFSGYGLSLFIGNLQRTIVTGLNPVIRKRDTLNTSVLFRYCPCQCNRPAGGYNYYKSQNYVTEFYFGEETPDKVKAYSENSDNKGQNGGDNHNEAQKTACRLDIKGLQDSALGEGKRRRSHSAGRARQAGPLLEAAIAEQPAHINPVIPGKCK